MGKNKLSSVSKSNTLEKMGEFWDTHDFTDFDSDASDVEFNISCAVPIEVDLLSSVEKQARLRGLKVEMRRRRGWCGKRLCGSLANKEV